MDISLFDFDLPMELIAQSPALKRDESRLLVIDKNKRLMKIRFFMTFLIILNQVMY